MSCFNFHNMMCTRLLSGSMEAMTFLTFFFYIFFHFFKFNLILFYFFGKSVLCNFDSVFCPCTSLLLKETLVWGSTRSVEIRIPSQKHNGSSQRPIRNKIFPTDIDDVYCV